MEIFRGESLVDAHLILDEKRRLNREIRIRTVKDCLRRNMYPTKMLNGGDPYRIVRTGLLDHVLQHISEVYHQPDFSRTSHLLSFSSDLNIAIHFGTAGAQLSEEAIDSGHCLVGSTAGEFLDAPYLQFVVLKLDISQCSAVNGFPGTYSMKYNGGNLLVMINSLEYLEANRTRAKNMAGFNEAVSYATKEAEWLVLPVDVLRQPGVTDSFTALMPTTNNEIEVRGYVSPDYYSQSHSTAKFY